MYIKNLLRLYGPSWIFFQHWFLFIWVFGECETLSNSIFSKCEIAEYVLVEQGENAKKKL